MTDLADPDRQRERIRRTLRAHTPALAHATCPTCGTLHPCDVWVAVTREYSRWVREQPPSPSVSDLE